MRRFFLLLPLIVVLSLFGCSEEIISDEDVFHRSGKTQEEWKNSLTTEEYHIIWEKGTELPFTGDLLRNKKRGVYVSAGCKIPVFHSDQKYDSGTGWPSFWAPLNESNIILREDNSYGWHRTEVLSKCGEHLGHVFNDGPEPTGKRYCLNSAALDFVEE